MLGPTAMSCRPAGSIRRHIRFLDYLLIDSRITNAAEEVASCELTTCAKKECYTNSADIGGSHPNRMFHSVPVLQSVFTNRIPFPFLSMLRRDSPFPKVTKQAFSAPPAALSSLVSLDLRVTLKAPSGPRRALPAVVGVFPLSPERSIQHFLLRARRLCIRALLIKLWKKESLQISCLEIPPFKNTTN